MPLSQNALDAIRAQLVAIASGARVKPISVGFLTDVQRDAINAHRLQNNPSRQPIVNEVVVVGAHIHQRRIVADGYTIADVLDQISSAMAADAVFIGGSPMQTIGNIHPRSDRLGNRAIRDQAIFECTARRPTAELFSVIPKGDKIKPTK